MLPAHKTLSLEEQNPAVNECVSGLDTSNVEHRKLINRAFDLHRHGLTSDLDRSRLSYLNAITTDPELGLPWLYIKGVQRVKPAYKTIATERLSHTQGVSERDLEESVVQETFHRLLEETNETPQVQKALKDIAFHLNDTRYVKEGRMPLTRQGADWLPDGVTTLNYINLKDHFADCRGFQFAVGSLLARREFEVAHGRKPISLEDYQRAITLLEDGLYGEQAIANKAFQEIRGPTVLKNPFRRFRNAGHTQMYNEVIRRATGFEPPEKNIADDPPILDKQAVVDLIAHSDFGPYAAYVRAVGAHTPSYEAEITRFNGLAHMNIDERFDEEMGRAVFSKVFDVFSVPALTPDQKKRMNAKEIADYVKFQNSMPGLRESALSIVSLMNDPDYTESGTIHDTVFNNRRTNAFDIKRLTESYKDPLEFQLRMSPILIRIKHDFPGKFEKYLLVVQMLQEGLYGPQSEAYDQLKEVERRVLHGEPL